MKKFKVEIKETLTRVVEVEAFDNDDAERKVRGDYYNCDIVLMDDDFESVEINSLGEAE